MIFNSVSGRLRTPMTVTTTSDPLAPPEDPLTETPREVKERRMARRMARVVARVMVCWRRG